MALSAELLGVLSQTRLSPILRKFLKEFNDRIRVDANAPERRQLLQLCDGMGYISLPMGNDADVSILQCACHLDMDIWTHRWHAECCHSAMSLGKHD